MIIPGFDKQNPLLEYAIANLWGNPEENQQYQVKTVKVSNYYGVVNNFPLMNKWRTLPVRDRLYHVFNVGGLDPGYYNFRTNVHRQNPLDRWINASDLCNRRGMKLDVYNLKGYSYPLAKTWVMFTYDGLTIIALEKVKYYTIAEKDDMWFRCYTPSTSVDRYEQTVSPQSNPFVFESMIYETPSELAIFTARYQFLKQKPGFTGVTHNGALFLGAPNAIPGLGVGDAVEIWHDPTVIRTETYNYSQLPDFYSTMDKKRKLIIHPPKREGDFTLRYFDDNDYYLVGAGSYGLYFNRNNETAIRQLTHVDVAIADDNIQTTCTYHPALNKLSDVKVMVLVRESDWEYQWPYDHQRIRYLYRMDDTGILKAMTGERSTVPEWSAPMLESGAVLTFTRNQFKDQSREAAKLAVGYNAATRVLSQTPIKVTYEEGGRGILVPVTYRKECSVWEYNAQGLLLGYYNISDASYYNPFNANCTMVEFIAGHHGRTVDYLITNKDIPLNALNDVRVYTVAFNVDTQLTQGPMTDVTGNKAVYDIVNGYIVWKGLDTVNQRGVLLFNTSFLGYTFELDHLDHSLSFAVTQIYEGGGLLFPTSFANYDLFLNGHPLIDKVDWVFEDQFFHIFNKEFIVEGPQEITFRAHQFHEDQVNPKYDIELGYVDGGVIGRFPRYNLREDRVTRTVIGGRLFLTDDVPTAETQSPDSLWDELNGRPYMVKHVFCPIKFVEPYTNFPGYKESREVDKRVSDYLTEWLPKPVVNPVIPVLQDKYRLFTPFMSVIVNGLLNGLISLPALKDQEEGYSEQVIRSLVAPYMWWLKYDPIVLDFDLRYFAIMPYANFGIVTVKSNELAFLRQVNDSYLGSACAMEGNFLVNNNVR